MRKSEQFESKLTKLKQRLESWREHRRFGSRIPTAFWEAAAELAREGSVGTVARDLRLDYYTLKQRVEGLHQNQPSVNGASFVELPSIEVPAPRECTVELDDGRGAKMTVQLAGESSQQLRVLAETFWRRQQ